MRSKLTAGTLLCAVAIGLSAHAASPRSVDVGSLDVAGVKTGMDYDQTVAALAQHFQVPKSAIKPDPHPSMNVVTQTKLPTYVKLEKDGTHVTAHFEGRVPVDPAHPLVAWLVSYEVPFTPQNATQMARAATEKYGAPSNAPNTLPMQWCSRPNANPGIGCNIGEPYLELSQVSMKLTDPAWQAARIRFVQDGQAVRPKL